MKFFCLDVVFIIYLRAGGNDRVFRLPHTLLECYYILRHVHANPTSERKKIE